MSVFRASYFNWLIFSFLVAIALITYWSSVNAFFGADDHIWLKKESFSEVFGYFFSSWGHGDAYRPIVRISFSINAIISGDNPFGWRITNILIHCCNSFLVFLIAKFFLKSHDSLRNEKLQIFIFLTSLFAALLFLTSPNTNVNVTWISARTHSLAAFFFLLGTFFWLTKKSIFLVICCFILATASYEAMAVFPFFLAGLTLIKLVQSRERVLVSESKQEYKNLLWILLSLLVFLAFRYYVLSIFTVKVGKPAIDVFNVLRNTISLFEVVFKANRWMIIAFLIVLFNSLLSKKNIALIFLVVLCGLVLIAPFSLASSHAVRFTYLVTAYFTIAFCAMLFCFFRTNKYIVVIVFICFTFSIARGLKKNFEFSVESTKAGVIAVEVLDKLKNTLKTLPDDKKIFIAGVPIKYKRSWVHATYFDVALKKHMNDPENNAVIFWDFRIMNQPSDIADISNSDDFYLLDKEGSVHKVNMLIWINSPQLKALKL